ncbi:MAG: pitrilysin family protein [Acidobacteriota bacterium]|nr:pitrilysin family protein [Acidobacteriota bacterium]
MNRFLTIIITLFLLCPVLVFSSERLPRPQKITLDNGLVVYYYQNPELPLVSFRLLIKGAGSAFEPAGLDGLANFTSDMLLKGTSSMTAEQIAEALDFMGARLNFTSSEEYASAGGECLSQFLPRLLQIASDCLTSPAFKEEEYKKELAKKIDTLKAVKDNPAQALRQYFKKAYFGQHPFGHILLGTDSSLEKMSLPQLKKFHAERFRPDNSIMAVVGDVKQNELINILKTTIGRWPKPGTPAPQASVPPLPSLHGQKLVLIDKPDATQSYFALGSPGYAQNDRLAVVASMMNTLWGGRFTSWLNTELRIKRGLTYGAGSSFQSWKTGGLFMASSYTKNDKIGEMLDITFDLLKRARDKGFSPEEVESARNYIVGQFPQSLETNGSKASAYLRLVYYDLGLDYYDRYLAEIDAVRQEDIKQAAVKLLPDKDYTLVIIGKASEIKKLLEKFGRWEEKKITDPDF